MLLPYRVLRRPRCGEGFGVLSMLGDWPITLTGWVAWQADRFRGFRSFGTLKLNCGKVPKAEIRSSSERKKMSLPIRY